MLLLLLLSSQSSSCCSLSMGGECCCCSGKLSLSPSFFISFPFFLSLLMLLLSFLTFLLLVKRSFFCCFSFSYFSHFNLSSSFLRISSSSWISSSAARPASTWIIFVNISIVFVYSAIASINFPCWCNDLARVRILWKVITSILTSCNNLFFATIDLFSLYTNFDFKNVLSTLLSAKLSTSIL